MPILPYRVERLALEPDGAPLVVYSIHDLPVATRYAQVFVAYANPFPPADPRHALTEELTAILTAERMFPEERVPWAPDIVERIRTHHAAAAPVSAARGAWLTDRIRQREEARRTRPRRRQAIVE